MTDFTPSKRLLADRDYYRTLSSGRCHGRIAAGYRCLDGRHVECVAEDCTCGCHLTDSERALFRLLADEIDGFLAASEQDPLPT